MCRSDSYELQMLKQTPNLKSGRKIESERPSNGKKRIKDSLVKVNRKSTVNGQPGQPSQPGQRPDPTRSTTRPATRPATRPTTRPGPTRPATRPGPTRAQPGPTRPNANSAHPAHYPKPAQLPKPSPIELDQPVIP
ncbi:hypothetical protein N665_5670s0001 [Sinapis alba]|nr:hypothetical protein N665_5670s0001 [Sinapis alba]